MRRTQEKDRNECAEGEGKKSVKKRRKSVKVDRKDDGGGDEVNEIESATADASTRIHRARHMSRTCRTLFKGQPVPWLAWPTVVRLGGLGEEANIACGAITNWLLKTPPNCRRHWGKPPQNAPRTFFIFPCSSEVRFAS